MSLCPSCGATVEGGARFCPFDGTRLGSPAHENDKPTPTAAGSGPGPRVSTEAPRPPRDPLIGRVVSQRYRVCAALGEGGMSVVYLARHEVIGREVALKVLRPVFATDDKSVARFLREAQAASRVSHDNVVYMLDFGLSDPRGSEAPFYYLVMEHVAGTPLDAVIAAEGPIPAARTVHIVSQIAAGVGRAHELGIIHRDLKPANVMLCQRGHDRDFVKILDFGLSRLLEDDPHTPKLTLKGDVFGTPGYMAPELCVGDGADARSDVYAIGVIAYELLTGVDMFEGTPGELVRQQIASVPATPHERTPHARVPRALSDLVMRCLDKDPAARPQTVHQLLAALADLPTTGVRARRSTYAAVVPAAARTGAESIPDPTVYQDSDIDAVWDGPSLSEEITRLHALRGKRLAELADALWGATPPPAVLDLREPIERLERSTEQEGEEIALLRERVAEVERSAGEQEAARRGEVVEASMLVHLRQHGITEPPSTGTRDPDAGTLDPAVTLRDPIAPDEGGTDPTLPQLESRLRRAERRLGTLERQKLRDQLELELALTRRVAALRGCELQLAPLYEQLSRLVQKAAARRTDVRPQLVAFGQVDGAIAAYQALLRSLEIE